MKIPDSWWFYRALPWLLSLTLAVVYFGTMATWLTNYADSDDLLLAMHSGGLAHPPGYGLLILIGHGLLTLVPNVDSVKLITGMNAVLMITAVLIAHAWMKLILTKHMKSEKWVQIISFVLALKFGLSEFIWQHAVILEIHALSLFLLLSFGYSWYRFHQAKQNSSGWWLTVSLAALSVYHHYLVVGMVMLTLAYEFQQHRSIQKACLKFATIIGLVFIAVYAQAIVLQTSTGYGWSIPDGWLGPLQFWLRLTYGEEGSQIETMVGQQSWYTMWTMLQWLFTVVIKQWHISGFWLVLVSILALKRTAFKWWWLGLLAYTLGLGIYLLTPDPSSGEIAYYWGVALRERMYYVGLSAGFGAMLAAMLWMYHKHKTILIVFLAMLVIELLFKLEATRAIVNQSEENQFELLSYNILVNLPPNAVLFVDGDAVFSLLAQQQIRRTRQDISIVPTNIRLSQSRTPGLLMHEDRVMAYPNVVLSHEIAQLLFRGQRVFLYHPDPGLLSRLGLEGDPLFGRIHGFTIEVAQKTSAPNTYDYGFSLSLSQSPQSESYWWQGVKAHIGTLHTILSYYAYRSGNQDLGGVHQQLAQELLQFDSSQEALKSTVALAQQRYQTMGSYLAYEPMSSQELLIKAQQSSGDTRSYFANQAIISQPLSKDVISSALNLLDSEIHSEDILFYQDLLLRLDAFEGIR